VQQTQQRLANTLQSMNKQQYTHSESNDMSEMNINRFIEAARQHLFGLFPVDAIPTSASTVQ
jgi:hypothetical protein